MEKREDWDGGRNLGLTLSPVDDYERSACRQRGKEDHGEHPRVL